MSLTLVPLHDAQDLQRLLERGAVAGINAENLKFIYVGTEWGWGMLLELCMLLFLQIHSSLNIL